MSFQAVGPEDPKERSPKLANDNIKTNSVIHFTIKAMVKVSS